MKKTRKKLQLNRDTVRGLGAPDLVQANGGANTARFERTCACTVSCVTCTCPTLCGQGYC